MNQLPSSQRSARRRRPVRGVGSHKRRRYLGLPLLPHRDPRFRAGTVWLAVMLMAGGLLSAVAPPTTATTGTADPASAEAAGPGSAAPATDEGEEPGDEAPADDESAGEPIADESAGNQASTEADPAVEPTDDAPAEKTPPADPDTGGPSSAEPEHAEADAGSDAGSDARIAPLAIAADGVQFNTDVSVPGRLETVWVTVDAPGYVNAWIDFDRDGTFDPSERLFDDAAVDAGPNQLTYTVPAAAGFVPGATTARFRESAAPDQGDDPDAPGDTVDLPRELYDAESVALQQCPVGTVPVPVSVIQNPSFEDRTQDFQNAGSASTISYAEHWYDSHPTGGQYHVFEPGGFDSGPAFPNPPVRAGADGFAFEGGHSTLVAGGGNGGEGAVNTLAVPLNPDATYVGFFSMAAGGYNRDGDGYMQFFGTSDPETGSIPNAAVTPQTAANTELLYSTPVVRYAGDGVRPEWELNTFQLDASQAWDHLRVEVRNETPANDATVAGQVWMNFDDFHMYECDPVQDFGDAPASYGTNLADDGPRHTVVDDLRLGALVDDEDDGFPGADATGDDVDGDADEDGVADPINLVAGQPTTVTVAATNDSGRPATLAGWIDLNGDGQFGNGAERVIVPVPAGSGTADHPITFPAASVTADIHARFRLFPGDLDPADALPTGSAAGGEVEDYPVTVTIEPFACPPHGMLFQYPSTASDVGPTAVQFIDMVTGEYTTPITDLPYNINGAGYNVLDGYVYGMANVYSGDRTGSQLVRIGADGTAQELGMPAGLDGFDTPYGEVDENGHYWTISANPTTWHQIDLATMTVLDSGPVQGDSIEDYAAGWDLVYVPGGGDYLYRVMRDPATDTSVLFRLDRATGLFENVGDLGALADNQFGAFYAAADGFMYASNNSTGEIFRIDVHGVIATPFTDGPSSANNDGTRCANAPIPIDFGDAPDGYGTTLAEDGPRHSVPDYDAAQQGAPLMLGPTVDLDLDGVPGVAADGDGADEDGVTGPIDLIPGQATDVTVSATNDTAEPATLVAWIDLDGDGEFGNGAERVILDVPASSGADDYQLTFPASTLTTGPTYARFRLFPGDVAAADALPTGPAGAGEVEDYEVSLGQLDFGDAPNTYGTVLADDGPRHTMVPGLLIGSEIDFEVEGRPTPDATGDDVAGDADEDAFPGGAVLNPGVTDPALTVPVTNTTGAAATLYGWIDSDGNGVFGPGEFASTQVPDGATEAVLPFAGISVLQDGTSPMVRLRLTSDTLVDDTATSGVDERALGAAADGEVEDHAAQVATRVPISCTEPFVEDFGTGTGYGPPLPGGQTTYRYEGASAVNDGEYGLVSALPGNAGTWWHTGGDRTPGDTDGRLMLVNADYTPGIFFQRTFTQLSPGADYDFSAWITNANNAGSSILPNVEFRVVDPATGTVLASTQTGDIPNRTSLQWERFGLQFTAPQTTVRLEIANVAPGGNGNDLALDDIGFSPVCEFGDAPQRYGTLIADDGAGHIATGPTLGTERDTEPNGQPNPAADGDDVTGSPNDEDAVAGPIETSVGAEVAVTVSATNDYAREVTLAGWVDIDGDGQFQDGERVTLLLPASSGTADYDLTFPALTTTADTYARFRVYGDEVADPRPTGTAGAGEVEDHLVTLLHAELDIDKTSDATIDARPGDIVEYAVTATNNGPGDFTAANPARVWDDLSGALDDAVFNDDADTDRGPDPVWANPIVSWTGPLAAGDSVTITYTVTLQGGGDGTVRNVAFGQCDPADPDCDPVTPDCDPPVGGVDPDTGKVCDQEEFELPKLTIGKVADRSDLPAVGDTVTYSVTVTNEGPGDYTAAAPATATDDLTRVLDDTTAPTNVTADVGTATFNDPELVWEGVLAAGQSARISYEVTYTGGGDQQVDNAACVPVEEAQDPQDPCAQVRIPGSGLDQDKVADPASGTAVEVGEEITYTLRFSNTGQAPAEVDTFDDLAGVLDDAELVPGSLSADTGLSATFNAADERIEVGGSVPVDGTLEVTYRVRVLSWADQGNHVLRNALQCQPGESQPCDPETTEHPVRALDIEKTSNRTAGTEIGDTVTYTVTAENIGEADYTAADPARVWDDLVGVLDDATYNNDAETVPTGSGTISYAQPVIQWVGAIGRGDTITLTYTVDLTGGGDLVVRNVAFGACDPTDRDCDDTTPVCDPPGSDGLDPATGRPCDEEEFGLPRIVDSKSVTPADGSVVEPGDQLTYTLTFENTGTAGGDLDRDDYLGLWQDDAVLVDPPGIQVTGPVGVTAVRNGDRIEVRGPLAPGETATVTYTVEVKSDADRVADGGDDQLGNALIDPGATPPTECLPQDDEDSTCNPVPRIVDSKSVNPADGTSVVAGSELTYTLTFTNEGKGTGEIARDDYLGLWQDDAVLVDPPGIQVTGPVGVTAVRNGDRIEVRGPLAPGETATVTYTVEVKSDADRVADGGDDQLGNALIDPGATPPTECLPQDDEDSTCNPVGQVSAEKTVDPEDGSTVAGGEEITYTLTFTNTGRGAASVNHVDRLGGVLDDADLVREPRASGGALAVVRDGSRIRITGELAGGATVRVSYVVQVKEYDEQADHVLENFLVPSGVASASCSAGDPSCTRNPIDPPAEPGAIPETGGPQLLWLGGALALLVCGGWLVVSGRRRA